MVVDLEIVSHEDLGRLRFGQFLPGDEIRTLSNWEYMDEIWVAEAFGFTELLRPARRPDVVRSAALDLAALPDDAQDALWAALQLPLRRGMSLDDLRPLARKAPKDPPLLERP